MKLLLDECIPRKFKNHFSGHDCQTVPEAGIAGKKNGELLLFAEQTGFQVFLMVDQGIKCEQNLRRKQISVIVISVKSNRLADLLPHLPEVLRTLESIESGQLIRIG